MVARNFPPVRDMSELNSRRSTDNDLRECDHEMIGKSRCGCVGESIGEDSNTDSDSEEETLEQLEKRKCEQACDQHEDEPESEYEMEAESGSDGESVRRGKQPSGLASSEKTSRELSTAVKDNTASN